MAPTTHLTAGRYHSAWELITGPHLPASRLGRKAAPQASSRPRKASQNREAIHHRGAAREPFCRRAATRAATMPSSRVTAWIFSRNPFSQLRLCGNTKLRGKLNTSPANKAQFQIRSKESSWNLDADILVFEREAVILIQGVWRLSVDMVLASTQYPGNTYQGGRKNGGRTGPPPPFPFSQRSPRFARSF